MEAEALMSRELGADDMMGHWMHLLETKVEALADLQDEGGLTPAQLPCLAQAQQKLKSLDKKGNYKRWRARLKVICQVTGRVPDNVASILPVEANLICQLTLQSWDYLTHCLASWTPDSLANLVADPDLLHSHLPDLCCCAQDAAHVYLDPSSKEVLVGWDYVRIDWGSKKARNNAAVIRVPL